VSEQIPVTAVSVVIPTFNRRELLLEAINSVLAQTTPVREVVVADDNSTDGTCDIISDLAGRGAPIIFIPAPPREPTGKFNSRSAARNRGVDAASGSILAFLDSDDLWEPQRIEKQLMSLSQRPQAGFAFCNLQLFNENVLLGKPFLDPQRDYGGNILAPLLVEPLVVSSSMIVRREALAAVGGWGEQVGVIEDYELTLRLAAHFEASYTPDVLVRMRQHSNRVSQSYGERPLTDYIEVVDSFLAGHTGLSRSMRAQARQGIGNVHYKLACYYLLKHDSRTARRHLRSLFALRPWDRRLLPAYMRTFRSFNR